MSLLSVDLLWSCQIMLYIRNCHLLMLVLFISPIQFVGLGNALKLKTMGDRLLLSFAVTNTKPLFLPLLVSQARSDTRASLHLPLLTSPCCLGVRVTVLVSLLLGWVGNTKCASFECSRNY